MEEFLILVAGAALFVAVALSIVAFVYAREVRERVDRLERDLRAWTSPGTEARGWSSTPDASPVVAPPSPPEPSPRTPPLAAPPLREHEPTPSRVAEPPAAAPPDRPATRPRIEWERWLGVRGAAVLGGIFLAVAGVLFFQYSIEHGLITKEMRVLLGSIAGAACFLGGEHLRRRGYALTANATSGAGGVILYAAFWSAHQLGIFPFGLSFVLMVVVTALCCFLAWRNESQIVAWLGLSGGFATPLLLSTGRDNPVGLFGYVLLLDLSFLFVANKRRWPLVGALGLLGTALIQGLWFVDRMGPATFAIGVIVLGLSALVFTVFVPASTGSDRARWIVTQISAVLLPFAFAIYFAQRVDVGYHLYPMMLLSCLLAIAASWMARKQGATYVPLGAAAGAGAMALVWVLSNRLEAARMWELVACTGLLCGVLLSSSEWRRARAGEAARGHDAALLAGALGMMVALFAAVFRSSGVEIWPFEVGITVLALCLLRLSALAPWRWLPFLACVPATIGVAMWTDAHRGEPEHPGGVGLLVACFAPLLAFQAAAMLRREDGGRRFTFAAAALACLPLVNVVGRGVGFDPGSPSASLLTQLALGVCMAAAATGARSGILIGIAALFTAISQSSMQDPGWTSGDSASRWRIWILLASATVFSLWPLLRKSFWEKSRAVWYAAALSPLFWYSSAEDAWKKSFGAGALGSLPALLALIALVGAARAASGRHEELRAARQGDRSASAVGAILYLVLAAFCLGLVLPVRLDREALPLALATSALAAALLWNWTDHVPLKYFAASASALAAVILFYSAFNNSHEICTTPVLNLHGLDFLAPGIALVGAALLIRPLEMKRARPRETPLYRSGFPALTGIAGFCGLFVVFLWITVEVENHFAQGSSYRLEFGDAAARDLSLSIAWAGYALLLLFAGMSRRVGALRWVSLVLLLATIAKVFLLDLEDLQGLYRVGSFLGLALSLLAVSLLYQRFVFRKEPERTT